MSTLVVIAPGSSVTAPMETTGEQGFQCYEAFQGAEKPLPSFQDSLLFTAVAYLNKSICGSSTVAIDNKIEQAMDLVKSHLMFAVREEVEVLKEQISELVERNNQLEYENSILRATASQETLNKLSQPRQPPASSS